MQRKRIKFSTQVGKNRQLDQENETNARLSLKEIKIISTIYAIT